MSESSRKIYLVAGASRGVGLALVDEIAAKDTSAIIYAGARDPTNGAAQLIELVGKYPGRIHVVKFVSGDKEGNDAIATEIGAKYGRIDTAIVTAAISNYVGKVHEAPIEQFTEHFSVNVIGTIVLFQSIRGLLQASPLPRFIPVSSAAGSLELFPTFPMDSSPYGTSKAALNWVTRKIHFENEWLVCFPQCPGAVNTDMSRAVLAVDPTLAEFLKTMLCPPNVSAGMVLDIITASTREKDGGQFHNVDGERYPW